MRYYVEFMMNGLIYIQNRRSGLSGCFYKKGYGHKHGDLRLSEFQVRQAIKEQKDLVEAIRNAK